MPTGIGRLSKGEGSFYTPDAVADALVDLSGYGDDELAGISVADPAAGDGALLVAVLRRICKALGGRGMPDDEARALLTGGLHAIELDPVEAGKCRRALSDVARDMMGLDIGTDEWDVVTGDALIEWARYANAMGLVIMNPPYVRIHNLSQVPSSPYVTGMCDLYYAFFDIAQRMLAPGGRLVAIAPSSWFTAKAGVPMRDDLRRRRVIGAVCDYGHLQVFAPHATTYTALVRIGTAPSDVIGRHAHDGDGRLARGGTGAVMPPEGIAQDDCWVSGMFVPEGGGILDAVLSGDGGDGAGAPKAPVVRNGYATLLDRFFMRDDACEFGIADVPAANGLLIPVIKASTTERRVAFFPYDETGTLLGLSEVLLGSKAIGRELFDNRKALESRSRILLGQWYGYGRTQGIRDTFVDKVAVQSLMRPGTPPRTAEAPAGTGVYGGIYVTGMGKAELDDAVSSDEFRSYVMALRKYKSGGYYAYGGKDLERFLGWWVRRG